MQHRKFKASCVLALSKRSQSLRTKSHWAVGLANLLGREMEVGEWAGTPNPGTHEKLGSPVHVNRNCSSEARGQAAGQETWRTHAL